MAADLDNHEASATVISTLEVDIWLVVGNVESLNRRTLLDLGIGYGYGYGCRCSADEA